MHLKKPMITLIRRYITGPTPAEIVARRLADAERELIEATAEREYFAAMEQMLRARVARLRAALPAGGEA